MKKLTLGEFLKKLRFKRRINQKDLAIKAKIDQTQISCIETGKRPASHNDMKKLSKTLKVPIEYLQYIQFRSTLRIDSINEKFKKMIDASDKEFELLIKPYIEIYLDD